MKRILPAICFSAFFMCFFISNIFSQQKGRYEVNLDTLGGTFTLALYIPETYDGASELPITIGFHGSGMPANNMRDLLYLPGYDIGAIVACPDYNNISTSNEFFARISKTMQYVSFNFKLDYNNSLAVGFSSGAYYAYNLGLNSGGTFAGVIGISPAVNMQSLAPSSWQNIKNLRLAAIIGTSDEFYPGADSLMKQIIAQGGSLKYIVKEGVQHVDNIYLNSQEFINDYTECYNYIFNQTEVIESDLISKSTVKISPNPADGRIEIMIPETNASNFQGCYILSLYSFTGGKIYETEAKPNQAIIINTESYVPGIYFLKVQGKLPLANPDKNTTGIFKVFISG